MKSEDNLRIVELEQLNLKLLYVCVELTMQLRNDLYARLKAK